MGSKGVLGISVAVAAAAALAWFLARGAGSREPGDDVGAARPEPAPTSLLILEGPRGTKPPTTTTTKPPAQEPEPHVAKPEKEEFSGRVVDEDGKPVAGVALRLVGGGFERAYALATGRPAPPELIDAMKRKPADPDARAVTDADGRFTIRGAGDRLVSESAAWIVDEVVSPGRADDPITAHPGFVLTATVVDASTGKPVETFEGHAQWSGHTWKYAGFDGHDGRAEIRSDCWWGAEEGAIVDLAVEAKEYVPIQVPVRFGRGESSAAADVRLVPLRPEDKAKTTIEVLDSKGKPFDANWWVRIVDPHDSTQTIQDFALPVQTGPGRYSMELPPGRWTILVKPNDWLGFLRWTGEVDLRPGENRVRVPMAPHGTLVVRWPPAWVAEASPARLVSPLAVYPSDGSAGSGVALLEGKTEFRSTTCLEGDWRIEFEAPAPTGRVSRNVRVRAGEETVVDFGKP